MSILGSILPLLVRMNSPSESDSFQSFDVFLCYNSKDKLAIRAIAQQLSDRGLSYWLDEEQLLPGRHCPCDSGTGHAAAGRGGGVCGET
ncbi:MAG: TIR domain-containing protein [Leptolyngbyaceae cyanobacterium CSU_1_4]|nr:TIR domain-containing protein [Leptolyngbyaceae cyanobacterium CSU_1_4]